ncbi:MAG: Heme O synthase, protoheme IX farnesyltransferase [Anaerolineae bacterium]|nr:MAG: Heme O synthase, protoheme IX farnesyltransferase [Anaerolineae bacterium]
MNRMIPMLFISFLIIAPFALIILNQGRQLVHRLRLTYPTPFARWTLWLVLALILLLGSGGVLAHFDLGSVCSGWPFCLPDQIFPSDPMQWLNMAHRFLVGLIGIGWLWYWRQAFTLYREKIQIVIPATIVVVLYLAQALLGQKLVQGFPLHLVILHQVTFLAIWVAAVVLVVGVGRSDFSIIDETLRKQSYTWQWGTLKDFLMLTKPIVVALLLVTTYAGMVIGAGRWPSFSLTFWTLLGGFLSAGGASAINQYLDREDDRKMQRTQKRPIPAGRLTPAQGLAFGIGISLLSFYIMVAKVNLLAALLSLAGFVYYVVIYSLWLKKATPQNIVIGGGAGAIPPLVGWAAATGNLHLSALFLFVIIFMWTPPHFWALALVRRNDYARAGVPMLPVVRGEQETRRQIFLYTLELVGLTLLLPLFGLGGHFTFVGAILLGLWLISAAWKVWKQAGNKVAWKMYRYSSMYLAFLFLVMVIDSVI